MSEESTQTIRPPEFHGAGTVSDPLRPVTEYEDIHIRELSIGFSGGVQDLTLYPEDELTADDQGNIRVIFHTLGGGEFVAYAGHTQWHSERLIPHRRVKGTLRPTPADTWKRYREQLPSPTERSL